MKKLTLNVKGIKGDKPTKDELVSIIKPLIPAPIKGEDGNTPEVDYDKINRATTKIVKREIVKLPKPSVKYSEIVDAPDINIKIEEIRNEFPTVVRTLTRGIASKTYAFTDLSDTFASYDGLAGKGLRINATATGIDTYTPTDTDEKVKYDASDPTAGYISQKFVSGAGISLSEGIGADENKLVITNSGVITEDDPVFSAWVASTDYLVSGDNISLLTNDAGYITASALSPYAKLDGTNMPFTGNVSSNGSITAGTQLLSALGTVSAPAWTFATDPNTGIYSGSADSLSIATGGGTRATWDSSGHFAQGTSTSVAIFARFQKSGTQFTTGTTVVQGEGTHTLNADSAIGFVGQVANMGLATAGFNQTSSTSGGGALSGFYGLVQVSNAVATGTVTSIQGARMSVRNNGAGIVSDAISFHAMPILNTSTVSITNAYGFYVGAMAGGTNNYGYYSAMVAAANRWSLYMAGSADNYIASNTGIGSNNPLGGIGSNAGFFGPSTTGRLLSIYSATQPAINLRSNINSNGGITGGLYFARELGQGDAHMTIGAIQARQAGTGVLAGGQLWFFTKNSGSGNTVNNARGIINELGYWAFGHVSPADTVHVKGISRFETSSSGVARIGTDTAMGAPVNPTSNIRMDIGAFSISGYYPILSQNAYWNGTSWRTTFAGYSILQYTDPSTGAYTIINSAASYAAGTDLSSSSRLVYNYVFNQNGRFTTPALSVGTVATSARVQILATTEQLRLNYDVSNYFSTTIGSTGGVTFDAVGAGAGFTFSDSITMADAQNLVFNTTTGSKIGTATGQKIGFWNATPVIQQVTNAYTPDPESSAYTGIDNLQLGSVYAQVSDLNSLRVAYETLRSSYDDLLTKIKNTGVVA